MLSWANVKFLLWFGSMWGVYILLHSILRSLPFLVSQVFCLVCRVCMSSE